MNTIRTTAVGLLAVAPLALAACSSGGSSSRTHVAAGGNTVATSAAGTAGKSLASSAASAAANAGSGSGSADICERILKDNPLLLDLTAGDENAAGVDPQKIVDDMQQVADEAPDAIKGDIDEMVTYIKAMIARAKAGAPSASVDQDDPKLDAAMQHYIGWINDHCNGAK